MDRGSDSEGNEWKRGTFIVMITATSTAKGHPCKYQGKAGAGSSHIGSENRE